MKSILSMLAGHPFCEDLSAEHVQALVACATEKKVDASAFLFNEGSPAGSMFLVLSGRVVLEIYVPSQGAVQVESIENGGVIGWSWLLTPHRWHFDARASRPTHFLVLDGPKVNSLGEADPKLGY